LRKDPDCPICGENPTIHELIDYEEFCGIRGEEAPPPVMDESEEITVTEFEGPHRPGEKLKIVDVREPYEVAIARIPGTT